MRGFFHNLVSPIRRLDEFLKERNWRCFKGKVSGDKVISLSDEGFEIREPNGKAIIVSWTDTSCINAFKRDLFAIDMICFEFYQDDGACIEINEQMEGFDALVDTLPEKFKGFERNWWDKVAKPAFATNFTELWKKS